MILIATKTFNDKVKKIEVKVGKLFTRDNERAQVLIAAGVAKKAEFEEPDMEERLEKPTDKPTKEEPEEKQEDEAAKEPKPKKGAKGSGQDAASATD